MKINFTIQLSFFLLLIAISSGAQTNVVHAVSVSTGVSIPVGNFAKDSPGDGHGFADPGFLAQIFYEVGLRESSVSYLVGLTAITHPLDENGYLAMWPPPATIESKNYNLYGLSGGAVFDLAESRLLTWQLKATLGVATISHPAHEMRAITSSGESRLLYRSSAKNSSNLNGSLGSVIQYKASSRIKIAAQMEFFRSRARHIITFVQNAYPQLYQQEVRQQIAMINFQIAASYSL